MTTVETKARTTEGPVLVVDDEEGIRQLIGDEALAGFALQPRLKPQLKIAKRLLKTRLKPRLQFTKRQANLRYPVLVRAAAEDVARTSCVMAGACTHLRQRRDPIGEEGSND